MTYATPCGRSTPESDGHQSVASPVAERVWFWASKTLQFTFQALYRFPCSMYCESGTKQLPLVQRGPAGLVDDTWVDIPIGRVPHRVQVVLRGESELLEVVRALRAAGGLAGGLDGGQQQRDQDADDRDDHQQLDQGEAAALAIGRDSDHGGDSCGVHQEETMRNEADSSNSPGWGGDWRLD